MEDLEISPARALVLVPGAVLSHEVAARELGLELVDEDVTHRLTVPRNRSRVALPGWRVRRADVSDDDLHVTPSGLRVTAAARTVVDLARVLPLAHAVAVGDSAVRQRMVEPPELRQTLRSAKGAGAAHVHSVAPLLDPRAGSVLESLLRVLLVLSGFPPPVSQHEIRAAGVLVARVDFCWVEQRLVVEADGFAYHSDRAAYRKDRQRMNQLESLGWRVLRFTWEDVVHRPAYVLALVGECLRLAA